MRNKASVVFSLIFLCQLSLATGIGDRGIIGGVVVTDDPLSKCNGASALVGFSPDGGGVFLNDISRGKVKKIPKGISYKKLSPVEDGETRELYEIKQPSWPIGKYVFTKDLKGNVLSVELISHKSDRELKRDAEVLLDDALRDNATRLKVPTQQTLTFEHTTEGCKLISSTLNFKVFPIEDNKIGKSDLYSLDEREYTEDFCNKFNELNNKKPNLMTKIQECSFSGSNLLTEARGFLDNLREQAGISKAPPWTPTTNFKFDAIANVRLGSKSIEDTVALSDYPNPQAVLRSMTDLKMLCDETFSMFHSKNTQISKKLTRKGSKNTNEAHDSISK